MQVIFIVPQIKHSEVDFWERNLELKDMELMQKEKMYPPKVTVMVYSNNTVSKTMTFTIEIIGLRENSVIYHMAEYFSPVSVDQGRLVPQSPGMHNYYSRWLAQLDSNSD